MDAYKSLKLIQKVIELSNRNRHLFRFEDKRMGYNYSYGDLYLDILGGSTAELPCWIDVLFRGEDIGRLQELNVNKYYPTPEDATRIEVSRLYRELWDQLKRHHKEKVDSQRVERETAFFNS